jgi:hypothetical protein
VKQKYLGDSYDAVKRLWFQALSTWAPLVADPAFIPEPIRASFIKLTGISMLSGAKLSRFSLLLDPDTGVHAPGKSPRRRSKKHVTVEDVASRFEVKGVECVLVFDQSHHRKKGVGKSAQRIAKLRALHVLGVPAFYYDSHAPFLFAFRSAASYRRGLKCLSHVGIPEWRVEELRGDPNNSLERSR